MTNQEIIESIPTDFSNEVVIHEWENMTPVFKGILSKVLPSLMAEAVETENYEVAAELRDCLNAKGIAVHYNQFGEITNILPHN